LRFFIVRNFLVGRYHTHSVTENSPVGGVRISKI
jgi:hypothetical protein